MTEKKRKSFSPLYVIDGIEELLINIGKIDEYKEIFINKYFSKATSWLGKFDKALKSEYYIQYKKTLEHLKKDYPTGWWKYFNPSINDNYYMLKTKQIAAKLEYKILK